MLTLRFAENLLADSEKNFYQGKIQSMKFFIRNVLLSVMTKAAIIHLEDDDIGNWLAPKLLLICSPEETPS